MNGHGLSVPITADPWGEPKDLEELHAKATQAIINAVESLRATARPSAPQAIPPLPLLVLGTAGIGKTHLFSRLRRKLGRQAILVHIRPITGADMNPRYVLGQMLQQLTRSSGGDRQVDALVGSILSQGWDGSPDDPEVGLVLLRSLDAKGRESNLEHFLSRLLERTPDLDADYLEMLLKAPFMDPLAFRAALAWLGGQDISETQAARIGHQKPLADDRILPALRTVARMAARSAPLVVVFDQLENLIQGEDAGRILAYGTLMMDLVDEVKDLVIVQMALESEWERGIRPVLSLAQQARVIGSRHVLEMPTPRESEELLRLWMSDFPNPTAPFPWPFTPQDLDRLSGQRPTPRMLLQELQRRLVGAPAAEPDMKESGPALLAEAWREALWKARGDIDERDGLEQGANPDALTDGLIHLARLLPGLAPIAAQGPERLQIGTPRGELRVALVHQAHHRSIGSALDRLGTAKGLKLGLREHWRPFRPTWKITLEKWSSLLRRPDIGWHWLERKDAERLLALDAVLKSAVSRDIPGPGGVPFEPVQVEEWVLRSLSPHEWPIAQALVNGCPAEAVQPTEEIRPVPPAPVMPALPGVTPEGPGTTMDSQVVRTLRRLRVASLDRLARECAGTARSAVVQDLKGLGSAVTWIGENIVCLEEGEP